VKRGEIRWYTFRLPDKRRPVLILTRDEVIDRLNEIIVDLNRRAPHVIYASRKAIAARGGCSSSTSMA